MLAVEKARLSKAEPFDEASYDDEYGRFQALAGENITGHPS